ncbi:MAG: hypothetical protein PHW76_00360 [Alphaproteobacteria bacterium]|nr:hypothetical protein [Alphaproteobacteria bacterium]
MSDNIPSVVIEGPSPDKASSAASPSSPSGSYTVTDVNADVTADTAAHARDKAIMQAERAALGQLFVRLGVTESVDKLKDDDIAMFVQSFEVQSERVSAVRYVGVFTIQFNPVEIKKKIVIPAASTALASGAPVAPAAVPAQSTDGSHLIVAVRANALQTWTQMKKRLSTIPQVTKIDTLDVSKGLIHVDLYFTGSFDELKQAATLQGLVLRTDMTGVLELYDGSMVIR